MTGEYVSAREAAKITGKVERTIRRWVERGQLPAERDAVSGQFRIPVAALAALAPAAGIDPAEHQEATGAADDSVLPASAEGERALIALVFEDLAGFQEHQRRDLTVEERMSFIAGHYSGFLLGRKVGRIDSRGIR